MNQPLLLLLLLAVIREGVGGGGEVEEKGERAEVSGQCEEKREGRQVDGGGRLVLLYHPFNTVSHRMQQTALLEGLLGRGHRVIGVFPQVGRLGWAGIVPFPDSDCAPAFFVHQPYQIQRSIKPYRTTSCSGLALLFGNRRTLDFSILPSPAIDW